MLNTCKSERARSFLIIVIFLQVTVCVTVFFNIPVARQVVGFFYLTFVPGFAILRLLKLKLEMAEKILFAAGLSITFLMCVGFFTNLLGPSLGISRPLELIPIIIILNVVVLLFLFFGLRDHEVYAFFTEYKKVVALGLVLCTILVFSIIGVLLVNTLPHNNNLVLLLMLIFVSALVGLAAFSKRLVSPEFYPLVLFAIALALLFHVSLFSNYIHGGDIFGEYASFKLTSSNSYWDSAFPSRVYSMLSVTILPTIYSSILGLEGNWILKIVYPLILALIPIGLFQLFKSKVSKEVALFSAFFFICNSVFFTEIVVLARQIIGELFYILLFLTIFGDNIKGSAKWLCFFVFSFGLVVSHYAMSYIFFVFIFAFWLLSALRKRKMSVNAGMVITFAVIIFMWYIYTSSSATFNDLLSMGETIRTNLVSDFLNPQSRGSQVLEGTGLQSGINEFWHIGGRYFYYATELLILIGFLSSLLRRRRSFFNDEHNIMSFFSMLLVTACIVVPNFATSFNMSRFYQVSLFFLAPFCILGGIDVLRFLSRKRVKEKHILAVVVLAVLIPFFLFQTGFVYEVAREDSYSIPLSGYRFPVRVAQGGVMQYSEVHAAVWLAAFRDLTMGIYIDPNSGMILTYEGGLDQDQKWLALGQTIPVGSYVYLWEYNVYDGVVFTSYGTAESFNVTQIAPSLDTANMIYSAGSCEIYKIPSA